MKYSRLTKEQFESLHLEFSQFLATQSIDSKKWEQIKKEQPQLVEEELDLFSDMIWDRTLENISHLENCSKTQLFLFSCEKEHIKLRVLQCNQEGIDLVSDQGWTWALEHLQSERITLLTSEKVVATDRKKQIFKLIKQGCQISKGERYRQLDSFFNTTKK